MFEKLLRARAAYQVRLFESTMVRQNDDLVMIQ